MSRRRLAAGLAVLVLAVLVLAVPPAEAVGGTPDVAVPDATRRAYEHLLPGLDPSLKEAASRGRQLFRQSWVVAPSRDEDLDGLGPLYNRVACVSCHDHNGRGYAPDDGDEPLRTMLVRLSGVKRDDAHPVYGDQFQDRAAPGVPAEGRVHVEYTSVPVTLKGGGVVTLRRPAIRFSDLAYGPLDGARLSPRIGQPVYGLGLLQAVSEADVLAMTDPDDRDGDGISGRVNRVPVIAGTPPRIGRFGWKANQASLMRQNAGAFQGDLGMTSPLHMDGPCTPAQAACLSATEGGRPEVSPKQLERITLYIEALAPPAARDAGHPEVERGRAVFADFGCAACHMADLRTAPDAEPPVPAGVVFHPYTDLLLHDMGPDLADGRPDHAASGSEWRTAPLWGIGLTPVVSDRAGYLHDGRARTLEEAVLWHGGEAAGSAQAYRSADSAERRALLRFLNSL